MISRFKPPHSLDDFSVLFSRNTRELSIKNFESIFANIAEQQFAISFPYGRTALVALLTYLKSQSQPRKFEIICPSYTCVVVAHAIIEAGLEPVFVDSELDSFNMSWELVNESVSENTLAVISTSLFGNPVNLKDLDRFRKLHPDVEIIQDCAHSFFAGNIHREGLAAFYGLNISKIVTTIFGGMVTTDDADLANWLIHYQSANLSPVSKLNRLIRSFYMIGSYIAFSSIAYFITYKLISKGILNSSTKYYKENSIDFPKDAYSRLGLLEAELGARQIRKYHHEIRRRTQLAKFYIRELQDVQGITLPNFNSGSTFSHFPILIKNASTVKENMINSGIELGSVIEYSIHKMYSYQTFKYFGNDTSELIRSDIANLPIHKGINYRRARKITNKLKEALKLNNSF
jgi:dTDP-4-amino-4,6-dideoxygalactose transaminase